VNVPTREEFKQFIRLAVRWGDCDRLGHVNNAKFFTYSESSRMAYFEALTLEDPQFFKDYGLIVASTSCDFLAQLHYPTENLDIGMRIEKLGRSSMTARTGMFVEGQAIARLSTVIVWFDYRQNKPLPIPESTRQWIRKREVVAPIE